MNKDKLYKWFSENDIEGISPQVALSLLDIMKNLRPEIIAVKDEELYRDLEAYKDALITVCQTVAIQQKVVIDDLNKLVNDPEKDKPLMGS